MALLRVGPLLLIPVLLVVGCGRNEEELTATQSVRSSPALAARPDEPAAWITAAAWPKPPGTAIFWPSAPCTAPAGWLPGDIHPPNCSLGPPVPYDPEAPLSSLTNPCERAVDGLTRAATEMQRRAQLRNESDCVNGWQYEWAGLTPEESVCALAGALYPNCGAAVPGSGFVRDDGVISGGIADGPSGGYSFTCIDDAQIYVKDGRVAMIESKGKNVHIEIGEAVQGAKSHPDYDEILVALAAYRGEDGILHAGHRTCAYDPNGPPPAPPTP